MISQGFHHVLKEEHESQECIHYRFLSFELVLDIKDRLTLKVKNAIHKKY